MTTKRKTYSNTTKRAAIYVRVSSEKQGRGEKVSPEAQEKDCRALCESRGYQVAAIYHDIEKYRVGKRLVEPSGTRPDRPGLKHMLADARTGAFDVIVAWREDRLYRSYRPMLDVLDCIEETDVDIELVKETFDRKLAPVKAWAARMELDAKHDRFMMGVAGRLAKGKAWNHIPPYGYSRDNDGVYHINPDEAQWVKKLFEWYAEEVALIAIRRRLIAQGAKQRKQDNKRPWHLATLRKFLRAEHYWTGKHIVHWGDETFEIDLPPLVDIETARRVARRREQYKVYPAGKLHKDVLAAGMIYCAACNTKMKVIRTSNGYVRKDGTKGKWTFYACNMYDHRTHNMGCVAKVGAKKIDADLWSKVWTLISEPEEFQRRVEARIMELQSQEVDAQADCEKLQQRLDDLVEERQWVITQARKRSITDADMEMQLAALTVQETSLRRELSEKSLLTGNRAAQLIELARIYRLNVMTGAVAINAEPETPEQAQQQFEFRRKVVQAIVRRVDVLPDKSTKVYVEIDLQGISNESIVHISDPITRPRSGFD